MYLSKDPRTARNQKKMRYWCMSCEKLLIEIEKAEEWLKANQKHPQLAEAKKRYEFMTGVYDVKLGKPQTLSDDQMVDALFGKDKLTADV